jgi:hypothetical protein
MKSLLILFLFSIYASLVLAQDLDNALSGCLQKAQYPEAIEYYSTLVKRASPDRNALFIYFKGLGQSYEKNETFDEAVKIEEIELKIVELDKHIQSLKELRTKN